MFYICAVCMVRAGPLLTFTDKHKELLERIVSPLIDMTPLKDAILLLCGDCVPLIQALETFQNTVLKGISNLLNLHKMFDDKSGFIFKLPPDTSLLNTESSCDKLETEIEADENVDPMSKLKEEIEQNMEPITVKTEPEDYIDKVEELDMKPLLPLSPHPEDPFLRCQRLQLTSETEPKPEPASEPEDAQVKSPRPEDPLLRCQRLQLTSEIELKSEPASEPEDSHDSEATISCDGDSSYDIDQWESALLDHNYTDWSVSYTYTHTHTSSAGGGASPEMGGASLEVGGASPEVGGASPEVGGDRLDMTRKSWELYYISARAAAAQLATARAALARSAEPYVCEHCALRLGNHRTWVAHSLLHTHIRTEHVCPMCTLRLRSASALRTHVTQHRARYRCLRCGHSDVKLADAKRHDCGTTGPSSPHCPVCRGLVRSPRRFWEHYRSVHVPAICSRAATFVCYVCRQPNDDEKALFAHMKQHFGMNTITTNTSVKTVKRRRRKHIYTTKRRQNADRNATADK